MLTLPKVVVVMVSWVVLQFALLSVYFVSEQLFPLMAKRLLFQTNPADSAEKCELL